MNGFLYTAVLTLLLAPSLTHAQNVAPVETSAKHAIVVEAKTGDVLFEKDADTRMPTSSMSKVLTMYLVFDAIKNGKFTMDTPVTISGSARNQTGSRMFVNIGDQVKIEDLTRGVIVQSGNDAAVALAEAVAGSEASFASMMNAKAKELNLANSHFMNATGMPHPEHYSTARDLAHMALALMRDYPQHYHFYSEKEFTYNNIKQGNRNPLLYRNMGVDGMKTGHTEEGGYGLIASALRDGRRILTVVNGLSGMQDRADESAKLIEWAYREYDVMSFLPTDKPVGDAKVWIGTKDSVKVAPEKSATLSLPRSAATDVKTELLINGETEAPIRKGQLLGKATIMAPNRPIVEVNLIATEDVPRLGFAKALWAKVKRKLGKE